MTNKPKLSFKDSLIGNNDSIHLDEESFEVDDFDLQEGDIISKKIDGVPVIQFSLRVHQLVSQSMDKTVIGRDDTIKKLVSVEDFVNALVGNITAHAKRGDDLMDDEIDYGEERDLELENDVAE
ncbi:hypothetical protein Gogos_020239 [Gossypium gossypioides]|uniref:Uncharacterized protein n=1 Tax=Gossypium gossypioides TaxID=34282 RepID=A0A7J9D7H3_GOSGO|nr:hypothetical protein [Gossypium gossypioides]